MPVLAVEVNGSQHDLPVQRERDDVKTIYSGFMRPAASPFEYTGKG